MRASKAGLLATAYFCKVVIGGSSPPLAASSYACPALLEEPPASASMRPGVKGI
jgi:hypothetical protein